jgi:hypothetical protein
MSKMPPQGSCSIPQILDLFFSHVANIVLMCRFQMCKYADASKLPVIIKPLSIGRGWGEDKMSKGL